MASRYQHVTDPIRRDVAARVGGLIWATDQPDFEPTETRAPQGKDLSGLDSGAVPLMLSTDSGTSPWAVS